MIIFYFLLIYGNTNIITQSEIFEPLRDSIDKISHFLGSLFSCPMCMGFWVGVFWSAMNLSPTLLFLEEVNYINYVKYIIDGCIGSSIAWVMHNVVTFFMTINNMGKEKILEILDEMYEVN